MLVSPLAASENGALVLLGEPGSGKTTAIAKLIENIQGESNTLLEPPILVDGVRLTDATFESLLGRVLRRLPLREAPSLSARDVRSQSNLSLLLVIDQLDESPMLRRLAPEIEAVLSGRDASGLRVIIACRTADYPAEITGVLKTAIGDCVLADLAPLTRNESIQLADSSHVSGEQLVVAAVAVGVGHLASVPLTLGLLVRSYSETGVLPHTASDVLAHGVRLLADENDPNRRTEMSICGVDVRLAIARRTAAYLLMAGRRTIWIGPDLQASSQDLRSSSLVGGSELLPAGPVPITAEAAQETLSTSLFTGRGDGRLAFQHSSIAAFLAAQYLIEREVPAAQLRTLFLVSTEDKICSIPATLRETAAWLVVLAPQNSKWLCEADPESLASHSRLVDSSAIRKLVVDSLLNRAPEIELGDQRWGASRWQLEHPELGQQLLPLLAAAGKHEPDDWPTKARVRLAVRVAQSSRSSELLHPLLDLADQDGWSAHIRRMAADSAFDTNESVAAPRLLSVLDRLSKLETPTRLDPDDELPRCNSEQTVAGIPFDRRSPSLPSIEKAQVVLRRVRIVPSRNADSTYRSRGSRPAAVGRGGVCQREHDR